MKDKLLKLKKDNIVIICDNIEEAKELFSFDFPYEVRNLSNSHDWKGDWMRQGFEFKSSPYNVYCYADWFYTREEKNNYIVKTFKEYFKEEFNYEIY